MIRNEQMLDSLKQAIAKVVEKITPLPIHCDMEKR